MGASAVLRGVVVDGPTVELLTLSVMPRNSGPMVRLLESRSAVSTAGR